MARGALACIAFVATLATTLLLAGAQCPAITAEELGGVTAPSQDGLISSGFAAVGDNPQFPFVQVFEMNIVCFGGSLGRNIFGTLSVIANFSCAGSVCGDREGVNLAQLDLLCDATDPDDLHWDFLRNVGLSVPRIAVPDADLETSPRMDCSFCFVQADADLRIPPPFEVDPIRHCVLCPERCVGARQCSFDIPGICCNFFDFEDRCVGACPAGQVPNDANDCSGDGLFFNDIMVPNHGIVTREDIGNSTSNAVQCLTTVADCCTDSDTNTGRWFFGGMVTTDDSRDIYQVMGRNYVGLQRNQDGPEGVYFCYISGSVEVTYYVGVYSSDNGAVTIGGQIEFILLTGVNAATVPMFILICISTGGPATTVTWTSPAGANVTESQIVTDLRTATYSNTLTVTGRHAGDYMCSVDNIRSFSPVTRTLTVTAASPPTGLRATLDQDSNTITVSWTPPSLTPTGYLIFYQATDGGTDSSSRRVTGGSTDQFDITGRNCDSYDITIVATSDHLPSTVVGPVGTKLTLIANVGFVGSRYRVSEGVGTVDVDVELLSDSAASIRVYTEDGSASASVDYVPVNITINLSSDMRQQSVPITIIEDELVEPNERFFVKMKTVNDDPVQFQLRETVVIIMTNDDCPDISGPPVDKTLSSSDPLLTRCALVCDQYLMEEQDGLLLQGSGSVVELPLTSSDPRLFRCIHVCNRHLLRGRLCPNY